MNHDIVIDENGNEHQAVNPSDGIGLCHNCSLIGLDACLLVPCMITQRGSKAGAIYKRKVTIKEYVNAKQNGWT